MGICIQLAIAKSVTKKEWAAVYKESLKMIKAFPLAENRTVNIDGIDTFCLVKTREREHTYGWNDEKTILGWNAVGDYNYMRTAEDYFLPRDLVKDSEYVEKCEDILFGVLPAFLDYDVNDPRFDFVYKKWGAKTQGEPYHMYLLSIACMIESRLGNKAFVYGDITRGQCKKAVEIANKILDDPIDIPDRCVMEKLLTRVNTLPISEAEKIEVFTSIYLANKGAEFGEMLRKSFSGTAFDKYWKKRFSSYTVLQRGFDSVFNDYILWGFSLEKIFQFIKFEDEKEVTQDKKEFTQYETFIKRVMDAKLHLEKKDCSDPLEIDQDEERPFGVYTYLAQFAFFGSRNKKIDRVIPIGNIRKALINGIGDKCDVNRIIDEYLQKESGQKKFDLSDNPSEEECEEAYKQDASDVFKQFMDIKREQFQEKRDAYDISEYDQLMFYESGDSMHPVIQKALGQSFVFYNGALAENEYQDLMEKTARERCEYLVEQNRYFLIRDKDWQKIFNDIHENKKSFARYYPMVRVRIDSSNTLNLVYGIILNDDLFAYCPELAEKYGDDDDVNDKT